MDDKIDGLLYWLKDMYGDTYIYESEKLKKQYRITHEHIKGGGKSVYCFVDFEGNIYKAATWNRPAKHVRGHVDNLNTRDLGKYSPRYLK